MSEVLYSDLTLFPRIVLQVARLQQLTTTLADLNLQRAQDFEGLKQEAERLKEQYEKESKSAADAALSFKSQLAMEQSKNSRLIAELQQDLKAKESEMSMLKSTATERSKTIADMTSKLETYRKESELVIEESKKKIASLTIDFEKRLARENAAHKTELAELQKKMQRDTGSARNTPGLSGNVIGSGFNTRHRNVASSREATTSMSSNDARKGTSDSAAPMSGWAGYKNKQYGGYLDNLSANNSTPQSQQNDYSRSQYRQAEKRLLLEAKALALSAKTNQEREKVDQLLAEANLMKQKAEQCM